jgi:hypothetical protein
MSSSISFSNFVEVMILTYDPQTKPQPLRQRQRKVEIPQPATHRRRERGPRRLEIVYCRDPARRGGRASRESEQRCPVRLHVRQEEMCDVRLYLAFSDGVHFLG